MIAYTILPKDSNFTDGLVDFSLKLGMIYPTLNLAMQEFMTVPYAVKEHVVLEFEFTKDEELIAAVNSTNMGSHMHKFHVKWLAVYDRKKLS
jgi:hypothetical protein